MGSVFLDVSVSLDGFVAGPDTSKRHPIGRHGERLHEWMFRDGPPPPVKGELVTRTGAVIIGRRTFDVGLPNWGDVPFPAPSFVLTHRPYDVLAAASGSFTFITAGPEAALEQARAAAGDRDIAIMGGEAGRQYLAAGVVDELHLHLVPVLLGDGVRLFEQADAEPIGWELAQVTQSPGVTHLRYLALPR